MQKSGMRENILFIAWKSDIALLKGKLWLPTNSYCSFNDDECLYKVYCSWQLLCPRGIYCFRLAATADTNTYVVRVIDGWLKENIFYSLAESMLNENSDHQAVIAVSTAVSGYFYYLRGY